MKNLVILFFILSFSILISCKKHKQEAVFSNNLPFNETQLKITEQAISVFENGTTELQYGYIENINDGRGFTAGRAGFTSATCDLLSVVERYTKKQPINVLSSYLPRLQQLCSAGSGSVIGLEGFDTNWKYLASDPSLRASQDEEVDSTYYLPAYKHCINLGLTLPISLMFLYDAIIQHGDGTDPDGLPFMILRTNLEMGGSPKTGIDEKKWIQKFMQIRRQVLLNPYDSSSQEVWAESVSRIDGLMGIYSDNNFYLSPPVRLFVDGDMYYLPQ